MQSPNGNRKNHVLRNARLQRHWTQRELAERVGATIATVKRWERQATAPGPYFRLKLTALFGKSPQELGLLLEETDTREDSVVQTAVNHEKDGPPPLPLWNIPYRRNPFFTGRKEVLEHLYVRLHQERNIPSTQVYALCGLGGIGKTQTALEYAYLHRDEYTAVLWACAETQELLTADMVALAYLLQLPEEDDHNRTKAVKYWLYTHANWLLILDNVEDFALLTDFIPPDHRGHLLLTTRMQGISTVAERIQLEPLTEFESLLLLLRRTRLLAPSMSLESLPEDLRLQGGEIVHLMDGLPLAIDQAGAYIEDTACHLTEYLRIFQQERFQLLDRRGGIPLSHPSSVFATITLCIQQIVHEDTVASTILSLCAFFHSDAIPEEFLQEGIYLVDSAPSPKQPDPLAFNNALALLRRYSLIHRQAAAQTLSIHRLVQIVLKEQMDEQTRHSWAKRVVQIVSAAFPNVEHLTTWSQCQRYLPHAHICVELIDQWQLTSPEAVRLLMQTSAYLREQVQEASANALERRATALYQHTLQHAISDAFVELFSFLRRIHFYGINNTKSDLFYEKITSLEQMAGFDHLDRIYLLIAQAFFAQMQGYYFQAENLYLQAVTPENIILLHQRIKEDGAKSPLHVGFVLSMYGRLSTSQGKYSRAAALFEQSGAIWDQYVHLTPLKSSYLHGLALLMLIECRYEMAQDLLQEEQMLLEEILGPGHPTQAHNHTTQAHLALAKGEYVAAERHLQHAKEIFERTTRLDHPFAVRTFHLWAQLRMVQEDLKQAETLCQQAVKISEATQRLDHPETASCIKTLADIFCLQGRWMKAKLLYQRVLTIDEETLGTMHPHYKDTLTQYTTLLQRAGHRDA